jgi:hypothetical protein
VLPENDAPVSRSFVPVQLRLGFSTPSAPVRLLLSLEGLFVYVRCTDRDTAVAYLIAGGVGVEIGSEGTVRFPVADLAALTELPEQVSVVCSAPLHALWTLVCYPPATDTAVTVTADGPTQLNLAWTDGVRRFDEPLPVSNAPAFLALAVPFAAAGAVWDNLLQSPGIPVLVGRARLNLDRFVEISALAPQKVEAAPLPALFRIDGSHFGMPRAYAEHIDQVPGFAWDGPRPAPWYPPREVAEPPIELSDHARTDLREFVDGLAADRARLVAWRSGLGRRVFCLAALESLRRYPAMIVCAPHALWSWVRNAELFERSWSVGESDDADLIFVTYSMLKHTQLASPAALVFDDMDIAFETDPGVLPSLRRFDGLMDVPRVGLMHALPLEPRRLTEMLSVLRPGEFRAGVALAARYPGDSRRRYDEHVAVYTSVREYGDTDRFRRSLIEPMAMPPHIADAQERMLSDHRGAHGELLRALRTLSSAGTPSMLSPKLSHAASLVREAAAAGRTAVVLTNQERSAKLLKGLLRPLAVGDPGSGAAIVIARYDVTPLASIGLEEFGEVVVLDLPRSFDDLRSSVGNAQYGPARVTVLHMLGSVDDGMALLAARRAMSGVGGQQPLSDEEIDAVLQRR